MATNNPTRNYDWVLPVPGGSIGSWGGMLNKVFGEDGEPLGVDGVLGEILDDISGTGGIEDQIASLDSRVDTLQQAGGAVGVYAARVYLSGSQVFPKGNTQQIAFNAENFDHGDINTGGGLITVPVGGAGLWKLNAVVQVPYWVGTGDDGYFWRLQIRRNEFLDGDVLAQAQMPYLNDGVSSGSGNVSLAAGCQVKAEEGDSFSVWLMQSFFGDGNFSASAVGGTENTFFEAVRLIA